MSTPPDDNPERELTRNTTRSALWSGLSQYWLLALGVVKIGVLARLVDPEYFGAMALAQTWVSYLLFFRFDFRPAMLSWEDNPTLRSTQFWLDVGLSSSAVLLAGGLYLAWPDLLTPLTWQAVALVLALSLYDVVTSTPRFLTERAMRQDLIAKLTIAASVAGLVLPPLLAWLGFSLWAVVIDVMLPMLVIHTGLAVYQRWLPRLAFDRALAGRLLRYGWTLWTTGILGKVVFQFDDWLVGTINRPRVPVWQGSGVEPAGFYWRAYSAGKMPMDVFAGMISSIALPLYARTDEIGRAQLQRTYRQLTWLLVWLIAASSTGALVATEEIVTILLGEQWTATVPLFRLMSLFVIGRPLYQNAGQLLIAIQRELEFRRTVAIQAVFLLILGPPAVWWYGAAGAAVVISAMTVLGMVAVEREVGQALGIAVWPSYLLPALTLAGLCGMLFGVQPWLPANLWLSLAVKGVVTVAGFGAVLLAFERQRASAVIALVRQGLRRD